MEWNKITNKSEFPLNSYVLFYDPEPFDNGKPDLESFYWNGIKFIKYNERYSYSRDEMLNSNYTHYMTIKGPK